MDLIEPDVSEKVVVATVRAARDRAVAEIVEGKHPPSIAESAIVTLDHALYTAIAESGVENVSSSQSPAPDRPKRGPRL